MWPKALIELLPHLTRLVPIANRYFQAKAAGDDATREAIERKLDAVSAALRKEIGDASATASTAGLARQLSKQESILAEPAASIRALHTQVDSFDPRLTELERRTGTTNVLVVLAFVVTCVMCIILVLLVLMLYQLRK